MKAFPAKRWKLEWYSRSIALSTSCKTRKCPNSYDFSFKKYIYCFGMDFTACGHRQWEVNSKFRSIFRRVFFARGPETVENAREPWRLCNPTCKRSWPNCRSIKAAIYHCRCTIHSIVQPAIYGSRKQWLISVVFSSPDSVSWCLLLSLQWMDVRCPVEVLS